MEEDLRVRGIPLGTEGWDPRAKSWWYGHGGSLDPETGVCVHRKKKFAPTQALIDAMTQAQEGLIKFNREKDALTTALGNDEHGGRVRGKGKVPWKVGFSQDNDPYCYRSRKRKTDRDADLMTKFASELHELKQTEHELVKEKSAAGPHEDHEADRGSQQRRSSVASTDAPPGASAPMIEIRAPEPHYPVDDVKEMKECDLHYPVGNVSTKVASGSALPCTPGALHHNNPIAYGYARVTVEDIVQGFEDLEIDKPTPEGERRLGDVKRQFILWKKKYIVFPGEAPRLASPPPPMVVVVVVAVVAVVVVVVVHLHLLHAIRRRPPIHNLRRVRRPQSSSGGYDAPQSTSGEEAEAGGQQGNPLLDY